MAACRLSLPSISLIALLLLLFNSSCSLLMLLMCCRILLGLADGGKSNKLELIEASTAGFVELKKKSPTHTALFSYLRVMPPLFIPPLTVTISFPLSP